jgi:hypothetical protein
VGQVFRGSSLKDDQAYVPWFGAYPRAELGFMVWEASVISFTQVLQSSLLKIKIEAYLREVLTIYIDLVLTPFPAKVRMSICNNGHWNP